MEKTEDGAWHFDANTFDEILIGAGIVEDGSKVYMTGKRFKEIVPILIDLKADLVRCHELCTKMGVPDLGGGTHGLMKRLEVLAEGNTCG